MAQPADEVDAQGVSAPHRCARGARDGELATGSPAAEVHWVDYAEHEHLLAHSSGTHMTMGSSLGDGALGAATGSPVARAVPAYDSLPWFQSGGETTREVGCNRQRRGLENNAKSEALTGEGCQGGQSREAVAALSSFGAPAQGRKVRGGKGAVAVVNQRGKRRMEDLTRYGSSMVARAFGGTPLAVGRRGSGGRRLGGRGATTSLGGGCCGEGGLGGKLEWPVRAAMLGGKGCGREARRGERKGEAFGIELAEVIGEREGCTRGRRKPWRGRNPWAVRDGQKTTVPAAAAVRTGDVQSETDSGWGL
jgi:hypothetical protein